MRSFGLILIAILLGFLPARPEAKKDSIIVSIITCAPGREVYELCGHTAVRIRTAEPSRLDSVWNYGLFDFNAPNFVYRFVKGETDYMVAGYPFSLFLPEYEVHGREVTEQVLNLSQAESRKLLAELRGESLPENRVYRYNYVKDNCATRVVRRLRSASDERILIPDTVKYGTFRKEMRSFHKNYPWYQFGIDLALGSGIDYPLRGEEEMFAPVDLKERLDGARFADGRPVVKETRTIIEGREGATLPQTKWYLTPLFWSAILLFAGLLTAFGEWKQKRIYRLVYTVWFGICGIAGCVVCFLVFISEHEATSPNLLLIWLNPLQLIAAATVWSRRMRPATLAVMWYDIVAVGCMMIVWPFQAQSANPAFFGLMALTVVLAAAYALVPPRKETTMKFSPRAAVNKVRTGLDILDEKNSLFGLDGAGDDERGRGRGSRAAGGKAPARGRNRR